MKAPLLFFSVQNARLLGKAELYNLLFNTQQ